MTFQYCFDGSIKKVNNLSVSSPRTWGCFCLRSSSRCPMKVFPTHVGVFLPTGADSQPGTRLPHARGGVSKVHDPSRRASRSSPRTWGCFYTETHVRSKVAVFPTHVGVFPVKRSFLPASRCLPHARGGVSQITITIDKRVGSSPRTWGCFHSHRIPLLFHTVFPTHVGVFLPGRRSKRHTRSLPHARGGVSMLKADILELEKSSPRTWGCFYLYTIKLVSLKVFPTHVGVFPLFREFIGYPFRLPHARGGVSESSILNC